MKRLRVVSVNMHMGVPEGLRLDPANERRAAIADLASFITERDAHVVLLQEVRNDAPGSRPGGVPRQLELLGELVGASDIAYGIAVASGAGDEYGISIILRHDVTLTRARSAFLPYAEGRERRLVLLAQASIGDTRFIVANVHLDHTGMDRRGQLAELERILEQLLTHGEVSIANEAHDYERVRGYAGPLVVGGDFNDAVEIVADALRRTALVNVVDGLHLDDPLRGDTHVRVGRIDHLLLSPDVLLLGQDLRAVPMQQLQEGTGVTDHLALIADLGLPSS